MKIDVDVWSNDIFLIEYWLTWVWSWSNHILCLPQFPKIACCIFWSRREDCEIQFVKISRQRKATVGLSRGALEMHCRSSQLWWAIVDNLGQAWQSHATTDLNGWTFVLLTCSLKHWMWSISRNLFDQRN